MTEPWEEAMERLANAQTGPRYAEDAATIRKHIEDQAAEIANLKREADVYWRAGLKSSDQHIEAERTIEELQRRIEELEAALAQSRAAHDLDDVRRIVDSTFHPSEPDPFTKGNHPPLDVLRAALHPSEPETGSHPDPQRADGELLALLDPSEPETG